MSKVILDIQHISKTFNPGTINEKKALSDFSLQVNEGDFITVIGGNGAGKSTLMNAICGVFTPDEGKIILDDNDVTFLPEFKRAKYLGRVFQDPMMGTAPNMSIEENMALAYRRGQRRTLRWFVRKEERGIYLEQLKRLGLGLENRSTSKVGLLSGGQRQSITLLMAALKTPKLLLLDEHTAALDPKTAKNVLDLTKEIAEEKKLTTIMITHNMVDAINIGNRLIMMNDGHIIFDIRGEEKKKLTVDDLLKKFQSTVGEQFASDKELLSK